MKAILVSSICALLLVGCSGDDDDEGGESGNGSGESGRGGSGSGTSGRGGSGSTDDGGTSGTGESGTSGGSGTGAQDGGTGIINVLELCGGPCACADGEDNDGDGVSDGFDTECTGPADNDEGSFATGISGDNMDPTWQDCFFDGNSGGGDDGCRYHTDCLTGDKEPTDDDCTVTQGCLDFCNARTPNGCDCFGCCTIRQADGTDVNVVINSDCQEENLEDCATCTPNTACGNECGECELCPGRTAADLPDSCSNPPPPPDGGTAGSSGSGGSDAGTPGYTCDNGAIVCAEQADCPSLSYYCSFGCCQQLGPD